MMKICLIGGGNLHTNELNETLEVIKHEINSPSNILVFPFAAQKEKWSNWEETVHGFFREVENASITMLNNEQSTEEMSRLIRKSDILFFTGGKPEKLMGFLLEKELIQSIKKYSGLIIGYSAGALVCSKRCIITKDKDYPKTHIINGLGLVDFTIEVHYDANIDEELYLFSQENKIIAIPNGSSILVEDNSFKSINRSYIIFDNKKDVFL